MNKFELRRIAIYGLIIPIAMVIGYMLCTPDSYPTILTVAAVFFFGCLPLLMKWHHALLLLTWNAAITAFFVPTQPELWMIIAAIGVFLAVWKRTVTSRREFIVEPSLWWPLIVLGIIIVITGWARGGVGLNFLGSSSIGAKRYGLVLIAIFGFFALSSQSIPRKRAVFWGGMFFLTGVTAVLSDLVFAAGPNFYFLYNFFPSFLANLQATSTYSLTGNGVFRLEGVAWASVSVFCFLLAKYGVRGLLSINHPWRFFFAVLTVVAGLFGGFRSRLFLVGLLFVIQFFMEGLHRTKMAPMMIMLLILGCAAVLPITEKLPQPFQRALSFLPVEVDPVVRQDAEESTEWRLEMWKVTVPELSKYLLLGRGYTYSATDYYLGELAVRNGWLKSYDLFILTSEYHSGPLSVIVPFGIWGVIAFIWFLAAAGRALYLNYQNGPPERILINRFILNFFIARVVFFFFVGGSLETDMAVFTGVVGLSMALNGGIQRRKVERPVLTSVSVAELAPA